MIDGSQVETIPDSRVDVKKAVNVWSKNQFNRNWKVSFTYTRLDDQPFADNASYMSIYWLHGTGAKPNNIAQWPKAIAAADASSPYKSATRGVRINFDLSAINGGAGSSKKNHLALAYYNNGSNLINPDSTPVIAAFPKYTPVQVTFAKVGGEFALVSQVPGQAAITQTWHVPALDTDEAGNIGFRAAARHAKLEDVKITPLP